jgi:plastocyanin
MRGLAVSFATLVAVLLAGAPALAGTVRGTIQLPPAFKPATARHTTFWRVENGALPIAPPLRDPRLDMIVILDGGKAPPVTEATAVMEINGYRFDPGVVVVVAGGTVEFKNTGRTAHVIHDKHKVLAAGAVKPGESRKQRYHAEGEYTVRAEEFPHMQGLIKVLTTPLFGRSDDKGSFKIDNVPDGRWTARLWYRGAILTTATVEVGPKGGDVVLKVPAPETRPAGGKK